MCNTWAGACLIGPEITAVGHGTFRAGLLWQPVLALTNFHCRRVTSWSIFLEYRRIKLHDRQLGGLYQQKQTVRDNCYWTINMCIPQ